MADGSRHEQHDAFEALAAAYRFADAAQETLLRVWRALVTRKGESSLSTWIFSIALATKALRERHERAGACRSPLHPCG